MDLFLQLADSQDARYEAFRTAHPELNDLQSRSQFYGSPAEDTISRVILAGLYATA